MSDDKFDRAFDALKAQREGDQPSLFADLSADLDPAQSRVIVGYPDVTEVSFEQVFADLHATGHPASEPSFIITPEEAVVIEQAARRDGHPDAFLDEDHRTMADCKARFPFNTSNFRGTIPEEQEDEKPLISVHLDDGRVYQFEADDEEIALETAADIVATGYRCVSETRPNVSTIYPPHRIKKVEIISPDFSDTKSFTR